MFKKEEKGVNKSKWRHTKWDIGYVEYHLSFFTVALHFFVIFR